ncbi:hypothetical protein [Micromonospora humida]|uniref:hypothetical protein n=1 Tax=Micromonospora humida TaxID=2809018 RepID=UPI00343C6A87
MRVFASIEELAEVAGEALGPGPWFRIDQQRVDRFADATDDRQWIHIEPRRAPVQRKAIADRQCDQLIHRTNSIDTHSCTDDAVDASITQLNCRNSRSGKCS